ncbi:MAG: hypothetical protein GY696_35180 [Gammaproteobacteria bacterium]|nr:hypothetical protein [Gammaproteobacteria bacterium]
MPTEISQGLSKNKYIFLMGYFGYRTRYPKHIFHWTPCKTEILDKKLKCVNFIRINNYFGVYIACHWYNRGGVPTPSIAPSGGRRGSLRTYEAYPGQDKEEKESVQEGRGGDMNSS